MIADLWAKKTLAAMAEEQGPTFHPLICHLMDVASVTEWLWQSVLERQLKNEISAGLGLREDQVGKWLAFWAGLHDPGKASPAFQGKWRFAWDHRPRNYAKESSLSILCPPASSPRCSYRSSLPPSSLPFPVVWPTGWGERWVGITGIFLGPVTSGTFPKISMGA